VTKAQALKLARAKWVNAMVRDNGPLSSTAEQRAGARAAREIHRANKPSPITAEWRKQDDAFTVAGLSRRYDVGRRISWGAFMIEGSGDTWEEACRAANLL
jgi:hypothetical protein